MRQALAIIKEKLINVVDKLSNFAMKYKDLPTLAFTHFQPAQPTTVGKRATLWIQEFLMDIEDLDYVSNSLKLLGCKGTTGTQASFMELFEGDQEKVKELDKLIARHGYVREGNYRCRILGIYPQRLCDHLRFP